LRAPAEGIFIGYKKIGEHCEVGELIAEVDGSQVEGDALSASKDQRYKVVGEIGGVLRGILHDGLQVPKGMKLGDIDPRDDLEACYLVSDKALAIGGGVLEAILSKEEIREKLWTPSAFGTSPKSAI
jgi:xanthine dehydrogenase accessory factor